MNIWALKKLTSNIHLLHKYLFSMYDALNEVLGNRDILVMKSDQNYILGRSERKQKSNKTFGYVGWWSILLKKK